MPWKLTVRHGPRVTRERFDSMAEALDELERRGRELAAAAPRRAVDARVLRYEPGELISARLELAGPERLVPSVQAGVDVRGDGTASAYQGRLRRQPIEPTRGQSPYAALRARLIPAGVR